MKICILIILSAYEGWLRLSLITPGVDELYPQINKGEEGKHKMNFIN